MVSTFQMQAFYRPNHLSVDTNHAQKYFEEEDSNILDENILDSSAIDSGLELSPPMAGSRRDSFAVPGGSIFSPKTEVGDWQSVDMQSVPSNNPFLEPTNTNPFRADPSQAAYGSQNQQWSMGQGSGTCTPLQYDGLETAFDNNQSIFQQRPLQMQTPFSNPNHQVPLFSTVGPSNSSIPTEQKDWMGQDLKNQSLVKRMRPDTPTIRSHNELRRGDGIRKKNARFDIPAERNLGNIDQLIAATTDEQEIKELKQQKRLLRNRQAALDSRQRKKMHTERLEDEKKHFTTVISTMEEDMNELHMKLEQEARDKEYLIAHLESLKLEKEELIREHTIETGDLRKKVSVLTDHVQRLEQAAMPSNTGYSNGFSDMDSLAMDTTWDNMGFMNDFPMEPEVKQELQLVPQKKTEVSLPSDVDKSTTQGGLLFMLFLVGAFVLSNRSTPTIPRVSEDVREASATLLDNIFKDAGVANAQNAIIPSAPQPSGADWASSASVPMASGSMDGVAPSMLGDLADSLTQPTQEQTTKQLFSLTPAQYNGVNSQDFLRTPPSRTTTSQGRRNLAEALNNMRSGGNNDKSAAEVYTRSLLWDQIPSDVVRSFAKMVAEANNNNGPSPHDVNS
ncbi:bZIP transcription factor [Hypoxylon rubiginosum]|uniref:BZIP transcription factor n=1 Tax=Hypoxylon rubiginosum TaxID=110542 RepID=A0ACC0D651_9PEZI|nr:bZIP transcription factor [Hypoxylon rubiginosum]